MEFREWLEQKFLDWRGNRISGASVSEFAREIGIAQQIVSDWLNGKKRPGTRTIPKLAAKYPDVYSALGMPQPAPAFTSIPEAFAQTIYEAIENAGYQIREQHIDPQSKEAERIVITVFKEHGFTYEKPKKAG